MRPSGSRTKARISTHDGGVYTWVLNTESFCECVLSCVKLVVSDLHVSLKVNEIRILVMIRMNHEFMEYMRDSYPDTPLSEFKSVVTYVRVHGGVHPLDDDEDDE